MRFVLLPASMLIAATSAGQTTATTITSGNYLAQVLFGLFAIVVLIFVLAWIIKRFNKISPFHTDRAIKIVSQTPIGLKEKLVVVEVSGQQVLIGVTPSSISHLHSLAPEQNLNLQDEQSGSDSDKEFISSGNKPVTFQSLYRKLTGGDS